MESNSLFLGATSASERISSLNRESQSNLLDRIRSEAHLLDLEYQQRQRERRGQLVNHVSCYNSRMNFTPNQDNEFLHERQPQQSAVRPSIVSLNNNNNFSHNLERAYFSASLDSLTFIPREEHIKSYQLVGKQSLSQEQLLHNSSENLHKYRIINSPETSDHQLQLELQYRCLEAGEQEASACVSMPSLERRNQFLQQQQEQQHQEKKFSNFREGTARQIALNVNNGRFDDDEEQFLLSPIANSSFSSRRSSSPPLFDLNCATTNLNDVMSSDLCLDIVAPTINKVNEKAVKQNYVTASYNDNDNNSSKLEHQDDIRKRDDQDMLVECAKQNGAGMFWLSFRDQDEPDLRAKPAVSNEVPPERQQQHYNRLLIADCFSGNHSSGRVGGCGLGGGGVSYGNDDDRLALGARCAQSECNLSSGHSSAVFDTPLNYFDRDRWLVGLNEGAKIRPTASNTANQTQQNNSCSNRASFVELQQPFINAAGDSFGEWSTRELFSNPSSSSSANQYSYSSNSNICNEKQSTVSWQKGPPNQQLWRPKLPQSGDVSSYLNLNPNLNKYNNNAAASQAQMLSAELAQPHASTLEASGSSYLADQVPNLPNSFNKDWTINNTNEVCAENYSDLAAPSSYSLSKPTFAGQLKQQQQQHQQQHSRLHQHHEDRLQQIPPSSELRCCSAMSMPCDTSPFDGAAASSSNAMPTFNTPFHRNSLATDSNQYQWRPQPMTQQMQLQLNRRYQHQHQHQHQQHQQQQNYRNFQQQHYDRNESPNFIENCARAAQTSSLNELTNARVTSSLTSSPIAYDKLVAFNGNVVGRQVSAVEHSKRQQQPHNKIPPQQQQQASHFPSPLQNHRSRGHRRRYHRSQSPHQNHHQHRHNQQTQQQQQQQHRQHRRRSRSIQLKDKTLTRFAAPSEDEEEGGEDGDDDEEDSNNAQEEDDDDESDSGLSLVTAQAEGRLPMSVAEQMKEQASNFVNQYGANSGGKEHGKRRANRKPNLQVRRTLRVKIKKSKPILGIAIEGGFNVSGQLLPRIVCVHEDGAAYQCGKLRASDLILEVNGKSTVNMTHDEIAKTIATAYYQDPRSHIEFLIGESIQV